MAVTFIHKNFFVCMVGTTQPITKKNLAVMSPIMLITRLDFGVIRNCFWHFFLNYGCDFSRSNTVLDISEECVV